jgi:hypothetical protein
MPIIFSKQGQPGSRVVNKSDFESERSVQEYMHEHPEAIPVYDVQKDKRLFVAAREFPTNSGPIDALAVDGDGDIYIVETKLYANADKRRVVAQALDYGASLWKHFTDPDRFISQLDHEVRLKWNISFSEKVQEFFQLDEAHVEIMCDAVRQNLTDGNLKFVVLMDSIDERLKDLITYVNQKSQFDIYGVELEYYKYEDYEIVIPKVYGSQVKKDAPRVSRSDKAETVVEILQDGEWHSASELRKKIGTSSIISVLQSLQGLGRIEFERSKQGIKARLAQRVVGDSHLNAESS